MKMRLEQREKSSPWLNLTLPLAAIAATLVLCGGLIALAGANVIEAYTVLFASALDSKFNLVETLVKAAPLVLTGLAVAVAFRAKFWNIGAEGQFLLGAMAAVFVGTQEALPTWSLVPLMIVCGFLAGGLWAVLPAILKTRFKVDDVVTTLLLLVGFTVVLTSSFKGTFQFGSLVSLALVGSLLGALFLLPALMRATSRCERGYDATT